MKQKHIPVLLQEVLFYLQPEKNKNFIDATLGFGGHAREILNRTSPNGLLLGIDRDEEALDITISIMSKEFGKRFIPFYGNFSLIDEAAKGFKVDGGIIADLGVSSYQLDEKSRGFSFRGNDPLDMRMDKNEKITAEKVVNEFSREILEKIFLEFGEEKFAKRIAERIARERELKRITTTMELANIIEKAIPRRFWPKNIHPATKTFQAIRITVNKEIDSLIGFLPKAVSILEPKARLGVISFHSIEDRIVKDFFVKKASGCECPPQFPKCICGKVPEIKIITKKPVVASDSEIKNNPRSRSAKLRIIEKL